MHRISLDTRQTWPYGGLITVIAVDADPVAHYIATEDDNGHGHQITTSPRTACGEVVPNARTTPTLYDDDRCTGCLTAVPDAEPYPAPPVVVTYSCSVCVDGGRVVRDGDNSWFCAPCSTTWPGGPFEPGALSYPPHVDRETGIPVPPVDTMAPTEFFEPVKLGRDLAAGENPRPIGGFLLSTAMRVLCSHDHPTTWVRIVERHDDVVRDGTTYVSLRLACGRVDDGYPTSGQVAVLVDADVDEPVDA